MENQHSFDLVKGTFTPEEAGKVLFSLIQDKINHHKVEILSKQIRFGFGDDVSHSQKRIDNLKKINRDLMAFLKEVGEGGKKLEINGAIELKVVE